MKTPTTITNSMNTPAQWRFFMCSSALQSSPLEEPNRRQQRSSGAGADYPQPLRLELPVESGIVSVEMFAPLRQEWSERKQSDIDANPKGERFGSESVRRADRDFRHDPEASEDFLIQFLILPSSFILHPSSFFLSQSPQRRRRTRKSDPGDCLQRKVSMTRLRQKHVRHANEPGK